MRLSLLFPPSWHPSQPYLSLPCLTAFLDQAGISDKSQRDLNIELLDTVLTRTYGHEIYEKLIEKTKYLEKSAEGETGPGSKEQYARVVEALDRFPYVIDQIEPAKDSLRSEEFYDRRSLSRMSLSHRPMVGNCFILIFPYANDGSGQPIFLLHLFFPWHHEGNSR